MAETPNTTRSGAPFVHDRSLGSRAFRGANAALLLAFVGATVYPFLHVLAVSLSDLEAILLDRVGIVPVGIDLFSYRVLLSSPLLLRSYYNSVLYAVTGTTLGLFLAAITAYPLSVPSFHGKGAFAVFMAITMFFGGGLIPTFLVVRSLGLLDTIGAIIIPGAVSVFNVIILRTNFQGIPRSLRETAQMDGANHFVIAMFIYLPLSRAIFATLFLFDVVSFWNQFFLPLIYLKTPEKLPLQVVLRDIIITESQQIPGARMAHVPQERGLVPEYYESLQTTAIILSVVPILVVYPFVQRFFVKGALVGALKG